ncbi:chromosome segregation protein SMC [Methanocalculus chunghsingensis]|uniref:Chromosome segregation protein SMC n=1 Tax=Methanocalculus chunghsingensis TaxID=156457 RepID=A0A8J7W9U0_9EURY|nr:AAA family ATPase [Methanocalculus chunghsingensis]MBR1368767.1 chromosome segregation protein SMC [Methanocalculus chunghsingensis]
MGGPVLQELCLKNILSFGPDTQPIPLSSLNVIIGPNGSGKSNLIEAISLLAAAPKDLSAPVREAGGVRDWLWKGAHSPTATIKATLSLSDHPDMPIRHTISFREHGNHFEVTAERIETSAPYPGYDEPYYYYRNDAGFIRLKGKARSEAMQVSEADGGEEHQLPRDTIDPERSVLSQVKDPYYYPVLTGLTEVYNGIHIYRDWIFGRYTPPRQPQKTDLPSRYLTANSENLALILNKLALHDKRTILEALKALYPEIDDYHVQIVDGGGVQVYLKEGQFDIPATRLSDGTLRYLCLLAILCHPTPPPLICIEEPELGLHPDVLPTLADLMVSASERCQLIVTTHSDILVDALTEIPESVLVCEKRNGSTHLQRLNHDELKDWLVEYRLGELWIKGEIGGMRW